jgi:Uma2 family endonuclease
LEEIQSKYDGICEYLNGEILFSSRTSQRHNRVVRKILSKLDSYFDGTECEPFSEQIEVILKNEQEQYNFLPDIFVVCEDAKTIGESFISSPKLIFEVVSEKYSDNDYFIKARIYQRFGVLEYNIVEPSGSITQYSLVNGSYGTPKVFSSKDIYKSAIFNGLEFELENIFK